MAWEARIRVPVIYSTPGIQLFAAGSATWAGLEVLETTPDRQGNEEWRNLCIWLDLPQDGRAVLRRCDFT